jgi:hypothetical protein
MIAPADLRSIVENFIAGAVQPSLLDWGEEPLPLVAGQWEVREWNGRLVLQAWHEERTLVRKIVRLAEQRRDRLCLVTERFPKTEAETQIADLAAPNGIEWKRKTVRLAFTARFRLMMTREFPGWRVAEVSSELNLEQSFSPAYVRALVRRGTQGVVAIAAPPDCEDPAGVVAQGLIWFDWVRRREKNLLLSRLAFFLPEGLEREAARRVSLLDPRAVTCQVHTYDRRDRTVAIDVQDCGNAESSLPPAQRHDGPNHGPDGLPPMEAVDRISQPDGSLRLQVRGLEFARWSKGTLTCGLNRRRRSSVREVQAMAAELSRMRHPLAEDQHHTLYTQRPEGWLESEVRRQPLTIDASLQPSPLYGQVPVFMAPWRDVIDLLGVDCHGRLTVIELKASCDLQLPFQALDYWMCVNRHLQAGDFERQGYFPGITLRRDPPRLMLVAPALAFHSTSETVLEFLRPDIEVTRIGLAADWRLGLRVMFRLRGAERPL